MVVKNLNSYDDFKTAINSGKPVLIDFWATWCAPCKVISPIFDKLSDNKIEGVTADIEDVEFYKVDVEEQLQISEELGIRNIPTFVLFKDGVKVDEFAGAAVDKLKRLVDDAHKLIHPSKADPEPNA